MENQIDKNQGEKREREHRFSKVRERLENAKKKLAKAELKAEKANAEVAKAEVEVEKALAKVEQQEKRNNERRKKFIIKEKGEDEWNKKLDDRLKKYWESAKESKNIRGKYQTARKKVNVNPTDNIQTNEQDSIKTNMIDKKALKITSTIASNPNLSRESIIVDQKAKHLSAPFVEQPGPSKSLGTIIERVDHTSNGYNLQSDTESYDEEKINNSQSKTQIFKSKDNLITCIFEVQSSLQESDETTNPIKDSQISHPALKRFMAWQKGKETTESADGEYSSAFEAHCASNSLVHQTCSDIITGKSSNTSENRNLSATLKDTFSTEKNTNELGQFA